MNINVPVTVLYQSYSGVLKVARVEGTLHPNCSLSFSSMPNDCDTIVVVSATTVRGTTSITNWKTAGSV